MWRVYRSLRPEQTMKSKTKANFASGGVRHKFGGIRVLFRGVHAALLVSI